MRHTNALLRTHLADIQQVAGNGSSRGLLRQKLDRLLRYELDDRRMRIEVLASIAAQLKILGPEKGICVQPGCRRRRETF
jgi:hypothetical protein